MLDDRRPDQEDAPDRDAELASLLCAALDSQDPVRISLMTRLVLEMRDFGSRDADLDRMLRDGPDPVWVSNK